MSESSENSQFVNRQFTSPAKPPPVEAQTHINISDPLWHWNADQECTEGDSVKGPAQGTPRPDSVKTKSNTIQPDKSKEWTWQKKEAFAHFPDIAMVEANDTSSGIMAESRASLSSSEDVASRLVENFSTKAPWEPALALLEFTSLVEGIAVVHPYAKMASTILLSVKELLAAEMYENFEKLDRKVVLARHARHVLSQAICDVYGSVNKHLRLETPDDSQIKVLLRMSQQVVECSYFIRDTLDQEHTLNLEQIPQSWLDARKFESLLMDLKLAFIEGRAVETPISTLHILAKENSACKMGVFIERGVEWQRCLSGTRIATLEWLSNWINRYKYNGLSGITQNPCVLFVIGGAGVGKSVVAQSIAKRFEDLGHLGSFFHFGPAMKGRTQRMSFFKAIAIQLGRWDQCFQSMKEYKIQMNKQHRPDSKQFTSGATNPSMPRSQLWKQLILDTAQSLKGGIIGPVLIVIDALDECKALYSRQEILSFLAKDSKFLPSNFRIVVMSRPDQDILNVIKENATTINVFNLDEQQEEAKSNIDLFIHDSLKAYDEEPGDLNEANYKKLSSMANGTFQWAVDACELIIDDVQHGSKLTKAFSKLEDPVNLSAHRSKQAILCKHPGQIMSLVVSLDGNYIVAGLQDGRIFIWNTERREIEREALQGHKQCVASIAFSPDGKHIISGSWDKTIQIWDLETRERVGKPLEGHTLSITCIAIFPDGQHIVSSSWDRTIRVWHSQTGQTVSIFQEDMDIAMSVSISPDGKHMIFGFQSGTIQIWNAETKQRLGKPLEGHSMEIRTLAVSPSRKYIASGSEDSTIQIWDLETGNIIGCPLKGHLDGITSVSFSSNGRYLVSSSRDHTVQVWDVETGKIVDKPLVGHLDQVTMAAFLPDGKHIVSGSHDHTIRIWLAKTEQYMNKSSVQVAEHSTQAISVSHISDTKQVTPGSQDSVNISPKNIVEKATSPVNFLHSDNSSHLDLSDYSSHTLLGAKDALEHINTNYEGIKSCFPADMVSEYFLVMAGFNENLIQAHIGYLQEIHIFISGSITDKQQTSLISNVMKYCSPFPVIILTPNGCISHQTHEECSVHIIRMECNDTLENFTSLVIYKQEPTEQTHLGNAEPSHLLGDRAKVKILEANKTSNNDSVKLDAGQQGTECNVNQGQTNSSGEKLPGSVQQQGDQIASQEDSTSGEYPSDTDTEKHEVHFSVKAFICEGQSGPTTTLQPPKRLRQLQMDGTFRAEQKKVDNQLHAFVNFSRLTCQSLSVYTEEDLKMEVEEPPYSFTQFYLKVAVNMQCEDAHLHKAIPSSTCLEDNELKVTKGSKAGHQIKGELTLSSSGISGTVGGSLTKASSSTVEKTTYRSGIKQSHDDGKVWWGYIVDDPFECSQGKDIVAEELPQADYFLPSNSAEKIEDIHVMLNSYWIMRPTENLSVKIQKKIVKCIPWKFGGTPEKRIGYSTIVQSVKITVPHTLKRRYRFTNKFDFETLGWDSPGTNASGSGKVVNVGNGKLEAHAWRMPNKNFQRIPETPL